MHRVPLISRSFSRPALRLGHVAALLAAVASLSCRSQDDTALVIHVISDESLALDSVEMTARLASTQSAGMAGSPMKSVVFANPANVTWVLTPSGGDKMFAVEIQAVGRQGDSPMITQTAVMSFQQGQRIEITMSLDDACLNVSCRSPLTCEHGSCIHPMLVGTPDHPDGGGDTMTGPVVEPPATDGGRPDRTDGPAAEVRPELKTLGEACAANGDCGSAHCVDGVCCNDVCGGSCQQCNTATMRGYCQPVAAGQPAPAGRPVCAAAAASTCKQNGLCDGTGACQLFPDGQVCLAAACDATANTLTESRCDGMGTCKPGAPITCAPFRCRAGQTTCARMCTTNADCDGQPCLLMSCGKFKVGATCTADAECELGFCTDGVCCDVRCAGQCQACNLSTTVGTCTSLRTGQPTGGRTACTGTGTCAGSCTGQTTCSYPTTAVSCRAASCDVSTLTAPASCNGAGVCPAVSTSACPGQLRCRAGTAACLAQCTTSADCVPGFYCAGTTCAPVKANGMTCTAGTECTSGQCFDGVCCNRACGGACEVCSAAGTCGFVTGAPRPGHPACTGGTGTCANTCRGAGAACAFPASETSCRMQTCSGSTLTLAASCDGLGNCPAPTTRACNPFVCGGSNACLMACSLNSQCVGTNVGCVGGVCAACPAGQVTCPNVATGCVNINGSDVANCGACGRSCTTGQTCVAGACCTPIPMTTACMGRCGSVSNGCGVNYTCTCPAGDVCGANNMPGICCHPMNAQAACIGKACGPALDGCGGVIPCPNTCTATPNTTVACVGNGCVRGCATGAVPLSCSTPTAPVCGLWDFESNTVEGWTSTDATAPTASTLHPSTGVRSLQVPLSFLPNPFVTVQVRLCPTTANVAGKRLRAHLFFVPEPGFADIRAEDGVVATLEVTDNAGAFARAAEIDGVPAPEATLQGVLNTAFITPVTHLQMFFVSDTTGWRGTVYIDDVHIE